MLREERSLAKEMREPRLGVQVQPPQEWSLQQGYPEPGRAPRLRDPPTMNPPMDPPGLGPLSMNLLN